MFCPDDSDRSEGDLSYTLAVDIWAIGEIAFRMLTNTTPFPPRSRKLFDYVVQGDPFPTDLLHAAKASPEAADCIRAMMAASPRARITTAAALQHAWLQGVHMEDQPENSATGR